MAKAPATEEKKTTRYLRYDFTEAEKKVIADDMAQAYAEVEAGEKKLKSAQSQIKSEIAQAEERVKSNAEKLRSGFEFRDVECTVVFNYKDKKVLVWRDDRHEKIDSRDMTEAERQQKLPGTDKKAA